MTNLGEERFGRGREWAQMGMSFGELKQYYTKKNGILDIKKIQR